MTHFSQIISYQTLPLLYCERQKLSVEADWWRFFASLPSASVAHNMGRWISGPPTLYSYSSVCASSFWPHATSICSIPISDLSFPCSLCNADIRDATRKNWDCWSHSPSVQNNGQLNKIKQSTLILAKKDNLDHVLLNCSYPAAIKKKAEGYCFLFSLETDPSILLIREQTESYWVQDSMQGKVMQRLKNHQMNYTLPFDFKDCDNKWKMF